MISWTSLSRPGLSASHNISSTSNPHGTLSQQETIMTCHRLLLEDRKDSSSSQTNVLACSATAATANEAPYRKGFLDHLYPKALLIGTLRVGMQQSTLIFANFMTEQLDQEVKRNKEVEQGLLTELEAEQIAQEWEQKEWTKRWATFPSKFGWAFCKYHAITLVMRIMEWGVDQQTSLNNNKYYLDKLTRDPMVDGKQMMMMNDKQQPSTSTLMVHSLWANAIAFLADYTVHQCLLCYGYYLYYTSTKARKRRQRQKEEDARPNGNPSSSDLDVVVLYSFWYKSLGLALARLASWVVYSGGSAVGTILWPGWGTLMGGNMAEGLATTLWEDAAAPKPPPSKED